MASLPKSISASLEEKESRPSTSEVGNDCDPGPGKAKLHGRAFYESIGSPKYVVAPMVNQSEFAWRMLTRSFCSPAENAKVLAYTPMFHAKLFGETEAYRQVNFQPTKPENEASLATKKTITTTTSNNDAADSGPELWLDGNPALDRPLFVQFCANDPDALLTAAKRAAPYCDAVDLNLGCPQGIARKGHYGAFLQEDQDLIFRLINKLHLNLDIPVTAKIRILDTREATLAYAKNVLRAGASIITVHGRRREQKGHLTGVADWDTIRWLRGQLPPQTVMFANGNILEREDLDHCIEATTADGVMTAEGNLSNPGLFAEPPAPGQEGREYWRGKDGKGGWRVDAVVRRYLDILHRYAAGREPPSRRPLFTPGDDTTWMEEMDAAVAKAEEPSRKKQKRSGGGGGKKEKITSPNFGGMQPHMFHMLRHFVSRHTDVRDMLGRSRSGDLDAYEQILDLVERKVADGLLEYERTEGRMFAGQATPALAKRPTTTIDGEGLVSTEAKTEATATTTITTNGSDATTKATAADGTGPASSGADTAAAIDTESSAATVARCKRPWWVVQPIIRPLPCEAFAKGAVALSKKTKQKIAEQQGTTTSAGSSRTLTPDIPAARDSKADEKVLEVEDHLVAG